MGDGDPTGGHDPGDDAHDACLDDDAWCGDDLDDDLDDLDDAPAAVDVRALLHVAVRSAWGNADRALAALRGVGGDPGAWRHAIDEMVSTLDAVYERGWQPADLVHIARRRCSQTGARLISHLIEIDARRRNVDGRAPERWRSQLSAIREANAAPATGERPVTVWLRVTCGGAADSWGEFVQALTVLARLPVLPTVVDPPSRWPPGGRDRPPNDTGSGGQDDARRPPDTPPPGPFRGDHDPKMLARIRALLAKAESTEFPEEAEALTGKAQALMSRYAIDDAVLDGASARSDVRARRMRIESPYASTKVQLLAAVGAANRVRVIWLGSVDMATIVGFPLELDLVEMLYTSLLVQATRAMTDAGRGSAGDRSRSFRRAFLLAYAQRIGERLARTSAGETADAATRTAGAELVLARRSREVDDEFDRLFPRTRKMRTTRVDARGWHAGRAAADRATIARGRLDAGGAER